MRTFVPTLALGAVLITSLSGISLFAQDQSQPATAPGQAATANAQPRHAANPQRQARKMAKKLGLNQDQESKLLPILTERRQQIEGAKADTTLAQKDKRARLRGIKQDSDAKVEAILTDTQKQQYEQMKQTRKANKQQSGASTNS